MNARKNILSFLTAALVAISVLTNFGTAFAAFNVEYTKVPDQIVCTPHGDLKTQVGLAWVTDKSGTAAKAQVMPKNAGASWETAVNFSGTAGDIDKWRWHKVTVTGLSPGTTYQYRVGDGTTWSETCEFTTAPDTEEEPFTFLQVNDTQSDKLEGFLAGQQAMEKGAERFPDIKFVSHGGDAVSSGGNEDQWQMYFDTTKNVLRKFLYVGVIGNHELENYDKINNPPRYPYRFNYQVPEYATAESGMYYSFDYGNTHFTVLHAKAFTDEEQLKWIKYDMVKNAKKWNIVLTHEALYSTGRHWDDANIIKARAVYAPLLIDQLGVDMIFQAHDHTYSRTYPILNSRPLSGSTLLKNQTVGGLSDVTLWDNPVGTVHQMNNACGIKYYDFNQDVDKQWFVPVTGAAGFQPYKPTYAAVTVTENEIVNSAYYVDGETETLIESQGIRKTTPQVNAPRNVKRTFSNGAMTLTWDAPESQIGQLVQRYVVYDENNAFTTENATYFVSANAAKTVSIPMSQAVYDKTNFVVKALGQHSVSEVGKENLSADPENPQTSLWVKSIADSQDHLYSNIDNAITEGSYATIFNNKSTPVNAVCVLSLYDDNNKLSGLYQLGSIEIGAKAKAQISLPAIDTSGAKQLKLLAYAGSVNPLKPGGMPLVLNKTSE